MAQLLPLVQVLQLNGRSEGQTPGTQRDVHCVCQLVQKAVLLGASVGSPMVRRCQSAPQPHCAAVRMSEEQSCLF